MPPPSAHLDAAFSALADPIRRAILGAPGLGRGHRQRDRSPVRDLAAGRLAPPQGARARGPDRARPRGAVPAMLDRRRRAARGGRLGRRLPALLGRELRPPGPIPADDQERRERSMSPVEENAAAQQGPGEGPRTRVHARLQCAARAGLRCVDRSRAPGPMVRSAGGARSRSARSTPARAAPTGSCFAGRMEPTIRSGASARLSDRRGSS